jgi:hypothetical protein
MAQVVCWGQLPLTPHLSAPERCAAASLRELHKQHRAAFVRGGAKISKWTALLICLAKNEHSFTNMHKHLVLAFVGSCVVEACFDGTKWGFVGKKSNVDSIRGVQ